MPQPALSGDSELWRYLSATVYSVPIPRDTSVALRQVNDLVGNFTGWDCRPGVDDSIEVGLARFQGGTGISTGHFSVQWWLEQGFPAIRKLIDRELSTFDSLELKS